jgi:hypothetical protein
VTTDALVDRPVCIGMLTEACAHSVGMAEDRLVSPARPAAATAEQSMQAGGMRRCCTECPDNHQARHILTVFGTFIGLVQLQVLHPHQGVTPSSFSHTTP